MREKDRAYRATIGQTRDRDWPRSQQARQRLERGGDGTDATGAEQSEAEAKTDLSLDAIDDHSALLARPVACSYRPASNRPVQGERPGRSPAAGRDAFAGTKPQEVYR